VSINIFVFGLRSIPNVLGGVETHSNELYKRVCQDESVKLSVFRRKPYILSSKSKSFDKIKFIDLPSTKIMGFEALFHSFLCSIISIIKRPDIVHIHNIGPGIFIPLIKLFGINVIVTYHSPNYLHEKWGTFAKKVLKISEYIVFKFSNKIIFVSNHLVQDKIKKKSIVIPNGVNIEKKADTLLFLKQLGLIKGRYIFSAGRFTEEKGFIDLIKAYKKLRGNNGWKLVLAGDADHETAYSKKIKQMAKDNGVILPGFVKGEKLNELFSHAGLFVLPSYHEGLPIALLEAMSYGLSCIVSEIPANRNVNLPDNRHFISGDINGLAEKLNKFTANEFSINDRDMQIEKIKKDYNWETISKDTIMVYREVLKS
jgi:glycosyltransferase involved in cell wall biosynthesis